jgi:hypothetical protein
MTPAVAPTPLQVVLEQLLGALREARELLDEREHKAFVGIATAAIAHENARALRKGPQS